MFFSCLKKCQGWIIVNIRSSILVLVLGGSKYGSVCNPVFVGSRGGRSGGSGGGAIRLFGSLVVELEGKLVSNGGYGSGSGGGGSGGSIWLDGKEIDGHGFAVAQGGSGGSRYVNWYNCRYSGGGAGGFVRIQSTMSINRDVLLNIAVSGGSGGGSSATSGGSGRICLSGNECNGHGVWSNVSRTCFCQRDYYGSSCLYHCLANITCLGSGNCTDSGGCDCDKGYVGYRCEHQCEPLQDCSGNGKCNKLGKCVCDACYSGDKCQYLCSGNGSCKEGICRCRNCYSGRFCQAECNGNGKCVNGICQCGAFWRGTHCEHAGCPGTIDCSGNGLCNSALQKCYCYPGWRGRDCGTVDCPAEPDCNLRGTCIIHVNGPKCVNCSKGWMGPECNDPCVHGVQQPMNSGFCKCDPCYGGRGCDSLCLGRGECKLNKTCFCDQEVGWRGNVCQIPGCPGLDRDCSGHGNCNAALHHCTCNEGWAGKACDIPDCPGAPDCFDRGFCNVLLQVPTCQNCSLGYMGPACNDPCINGLQVPMDSGNCECFPGYSGVGCDSECSQHGYILNGTCQCAKAWRGTLCDIPGCPGMNDDCSGHGSCNSATHECTCYEGWTGKG